MPEALEWVKPVVLQGSIVRLEPLRLDHAESLANHLDVDFYRLFPGPWPKSATPEGLRDFIEYTLQLPVRLSFAKILQETGEAIGMTSFMDIRAEHRGLEVGSTWIGHKYQGTKVNPECKLLLLEHAFERLDAVRVQLKTDERNLRSQAAIRKLGAKYEGTLRHQAIMPDGFVRNSVMFSVTPDEWPAVKAGLQDRLR